MGFDLEVWAWKELPAEVIFSASGEVASNFFYNDRTDTPTRRDFERLIAEVFDEMLAVWSGSLSEGPDQPPGSLLRYLEDAGFPLWEDDEE